MGWDRTNAFSRRALLAVLAAVVAAAVGWAIWGSRESGSQSSPTAQDVSPPPAAAPSVSAPLLPAAARPDLDPEAARRGEQYFREAVDWLDALGSARTGPMRSAWWEANAKIELGGRRVEGMIRLWMAGRDSLRVDVRNAAGTQSTWFLGDATWIRRAQELSEVTPDDPRVADARVCQEFWPTLSSIVHLGDLLTSDIRFEFVGPTEGTGTYSGKWLKVIRHAPSQPRMTFWFAYEQDPDGTLHPQHPGVVRVHDPGPAWGGTDYILRDWQRDADPRPRKIEGYRVSKGGPPQRFLFALVEEFRLNRDVADALRPN